MATSEPIHLLTDTGPACGTTEAMWTSSAESVVSCPICRAVIELRLPRGCQADRRLVQAFARWLANAPA